MKHAILSALAAVALFTACHYDEELTLCDVSVQLVYPDDTVEPYEGARVEMKDGAGSIFVDSTDAGGAARFLLPAGIYEASSSDTHLTYDWRYNFNGLKSFIIVAPDSLNQVQLNLKMSRKRIVH